MIEEISEWVKEVVKEAREVSQKAVSRTEKADVLAGEAVEGFKKVSPDAKDKAETSKYVKDGGIKAF